MHHTKEVRQFLTDQMHLKISELIARYMVELSDNDDAKKTVEANDFINSILLGQPMKLDKDKSFLERNKNIFQEIHGYSDDIKFIDSIK